MSSYSKYAGTVSQSGSEDPVWSALGEMDGAPDDSYGSVQVPGDGGANQSKTLLLSNFSFAIPLGSTITGVLATLRAMGGALSTGSISLAGVTGLGTKSFNFNSMAPELEDRPFGGASDLWGATPTVAEINNANFGIAVQAETPGPGDSEVSIDSCQITVFFTSPGTITGTTPTGGISTVAYGTNETVSSSTVGPRLRYEATHIQPKTFAAGSITLAPLTPVAFNTSTNFWEIFASGGANGTGTIKGFVGPDPIVLAAGNEVLGNVIMSGIVHLGDVPIVAGYTLAQLKTALRGNIRSLGFTIQGMEKMY